MLLALRRVTMAQEGLKGNTSRIPYLLAISAEGILETHSDIKFTPGGSPFTNFSVAVNRGRKGPDGQMTGICQDSVGSPTSGMSVQGGRERCRASLPA